jgi:cytochrome c oxidase subunit II
MMSSVLEPAGTQAGHIAGLWWLMFWVCAGILALVTITLLIALFRSRAESESAAAPHLPLNRASERRTARAVAVCVAVTTAILLVFLAASVVIGHRMAVLASDNAVTIKLTGYRWWWKVEYSDPSPANHVVTANEIHIPVGRPVLINLQSHDVIHSFWVPALNGKKDLIPGNPSAVWLKADEAGVFDGQCAEFCGFQHAHMRLVVVAEGEEKFQSWLEAQRQSARPPATPDAQRGQEVFVTGPCALCHAIRGTNAGGQVAPDLTHLASRAKLAAGTLPNTPGHLAGWIIDSQHVKPGNAMPPTSLSAEDLQALLAYLGGLT